MQLQLTNISILVMKSKSIRQVLVSMGEKYNGGNRRRLQQFINKNNISTQHFKNYKKKHLISGKYIAANLDKIGKLKSLCYVCGNTTNLTLIIHEDKPTIMCESCTDLTS